MAKPLTKLALDIQRTEITLAPDVRGETASGSPGAKPLSSAFFESLPCVFYECKSSLELSYISPNSFDLIGLRGSELIGKRLLWDEKIAPEDLQAVSDKLVELEAAGIVSVIHRIVGESGLPLWVSHSLHRVKAQGFDVIRGCIMPLYNEKRMQGIDPAVISRFVHKLGNQFQLLNLVINSLRKGLPESRETEILQQAVEKSIEVARAFSDFSQASTWMSTVDLTEILRAALVTKRSAFTQKGVTLDERVSPSVGARSVYGDPFLLEVALSNIIHNAFEATDAGGKVELHADIEPNQDRAFVAKLCVIDSGCGIPENSLENVLTPFFTLKKDHEGLGLSMAARFIELHGGILRITSTEGKGTKVEITLPTVQSAQESDF
ncbi:MAG: sensor histidine kinase [Alphaproteobacteria bacterium]